MSRLTDSDIFGQDKGGGAGGRGAGRAQYGGDLVPETNPLRPATAAPMTLHRIRVT